MGSQPRPHGARSQRANTQEWPPLPGSLEEAAILQALLPLFGGFLPIHQPLLPCTGNSFHSDDLDLTKRSFLSVFLSPQNLGPKMESPL